MVALGFGQAVRRRITALGCGPLGLPRAGWLLGLVLLALPACFEAWSPSGQFACARDGTCPGSFECDTPFTGTAVCCDRTRGGCPTLLASDGTCRGGSSGVIFFRDRDGDGYGNPNEPVRRCAQPLGFALADAGADCDDSRADVNPRTPETCNGVDDNCDGDIDESLMPRQFFGRDEDGDGYPQHDAGVYACMAPPGTLPIADHLHDCEWLDPAKHPDAGELCNDFDDDCDLRKDASRYLDTQLTSDPVRLPCTANANGICATGVITCDRGVRPVCTSIVSPSWERCDGIDTDCDGNDDNQPGCGGPLRLTGQSSFTYGGGVFPVNSTITTTCQKSRVATPGTNTGGRLSGSRPVSAESYLLWWVEAPVGQEWDLSARDLRLRLRWNASGTGPDAARGLWGISGTSQDGIYPVVHLCTDDPSTIVRYRWRDLATAWNQLDSSFDSTFFLDTRAPTPDFITGIGSGADTRKVRRIEVLFRVFSGTYVLDMQPEAGFLK
ncbi:MAG: putative metal-binding motif-containing protein [Myxococcaceae bacterium]|nr:putative metal-binding motif-containing protein [Myxococcaceae bacterium]